MKLSHRSSDRAYKATKWLAVAMGLIAFFGFVDASYLTMKHFQGEAPKCTVLSGCESVTTSIYSTVGPIPVALVGAIYYLLIFLGAAGYFDSKRELLLRGIAWYTFAGLTASAWFVYLQLFVLNALCLYCMVSATTSTLLFILGMISIKKLNKLQTT